MIDVSLSKEVMNFNTKVQKESKYKDGNSNIKVEKNNNAPKESFKDTFNKVKEEPKAKSKPTNSKEDNKVEAKDSLKDLVSSLKENTVANEGKEFSIEEIETLLKDESISWDTLLGENITLNNEDVDIEEVLNQLATLINNLFISQEINKEINIKLPVDNEIEIDTALNNKELLNTNDFSKNNEVLSGFNMEDALNKVDTKENNIIKGENIKNIFSQIINALNTEEIASTLNNEEVSLVKDALSMIFGQALEDECNKIDKATVNEKLSTLILKDEVTNTEKIQPLKEGSLNNDLKEQESTTELLKNANKEIQSDNKGFSISEKSTDNKEDKILSKILTGDNVSDKLSTFQDRLTLKNNFEVTEPSVVHKTTVVKDIIKNISFMSKNAIQELKVKIYPKELGEMTIKILSEEGILKAEIKATSKETYNLLNSNLNELKKTLSDQNIKIQEVNIGLYQEDATFFSGENKKEFERNNANPSKGNSKIDEATIEVEENNAYVDNSLNMLA